MGSLLDLPGLRDRWQPAHGIIPTEDRDLTRSQPQWSITFPRDMNLADDADIEEGNKFVKQVQQFMSSGPLGVKYSGPIDGKPNDDLVIALNKLQISLQNKLDKPLLVNVGSSSKLNQSGVQQLGTAYWAYLKKEKPEVIQQQTKPKEKAPEESISSSATIKAFQIFLSQTQPLIGRVYQGPTNGQVNDSLIKAAKQVESVIASYIDNQSAHGSLWNDRKQTFNTTPADLKSALQLIVSHQARKKGGNNIHQERIISFSSLLLNK